MMDAIILIITVSTVAIVMTKSPKTPLIAVIIGGLLIGVVVSVIVSNIIPSISSKLNAYYYYMEDKALNNFNDMGYFQIFPPLLVVVILFFGLLYAGYLG